MAAIAPDIAGFSDLRLIGRGGSAVVYRGHQDQLERDVAIKVIRPGEADERTRNLFDAERRALGRLPKQQNIVTVYNSGFTAAGDPYLAMELCSSGSLAGLIRHAGPLGPDLAARVGQRIAAALAFAHRFGMIHRDVKPENVLISDLGEPVLSDFGIAALLDHEATTSEGAISPHHVPPEILRGAAPSATADLYSLGSTVFTMLMGHAPHQRFHGERLQIAEVLGRVVDPSFRPELPDDSRCPRELGVLVRSLLEKDPARRLSPASVVADAFRGIEERWGTAGRALPLPAVEVAPPLSVGHGSEARDGSGSLSRSSGSRPSHAAIGTGAALAADATSTVRVGGSVQARDHGSLPTTGRFPTRDPHTLGEPHAPGTSPVDEINGAGVGRGARFGRRGPTAHGRTTLPPQSLSSIDSDATIVAQRAVDRPQTAPRSEASSTQRRIAADASAAGTATGTRPGRRWAGAALVVTCGAAAALTATRVLAPDRRASVDSRPAPTGVVPVGPADGDLRAPTGIEWRVVSNDVVEVSWQRDPDTAVQYQVDVLRQNRAVEEVQAASPPVSLKGLDLAQWLPCVRVGAVLPARQLVAFADPLCVERAPTASTEPFAKSNELPITDGAR